MQKSFLLFVLCFFFLKQIQGICRNNWDCKSCARDKSWLGSCRWCPVTETCHATASPKNKCFITQNIKDPDECVSEVETVPDKTDETDYEEYPPKKTRKVFTQEDYSPNKAKTMAWLSQVAYKDENDMKRSLRNKNYRSIFTVSKSCPNGDKKWICAGFTAVKHEEKMIVVAFRGSQGFKQVIDIAKTTLGNPRKSFTAGGRVEKYFNDAFNMLWNELSLKSRTYQLIDDNSDYRVYFTGHSLGGAMASLASTAIVHDGKTSKTRAVLYTFGQPRTGDYFYAKKHDELVKASWRVVNSGDLVPHFPNCKKFRRIPVCVGFSSSPYHHGTEIFYEKKASVDDYKKCLGLPYNEDLTCGNNLLQIPCNPFDGCYEHLHYLGAVYNS